MSFASNIKNGQWGDAVETITSATGIKSAVEAITNGKCGCDERKEKLNNFGKKVMNSSIQSNLEKKTN